MRKGCDFKTFIKEVFSEDGTGSCKRVAGTFILFITLICIVYLTVTSGCIPCVESLLLTLIIAGCTLLGVSSVTNIWKKPNKNNDGENLH